MPIGLLTVALAAVSGPLSSPSASAVVSSPVGKVTTVAGSFPFGQPNAVAIASDGSMYVADTSNNAIRVIATDGTVSTLALPVGVSLNTPTGLTFDQQGYLIVADRDNGRVLRFTPAGKVITLAAGLSLPSGVAVDANNNVFVAELSGNKITKITPDGAVVPFVGSGNAGSANGTGADAEFASPRSLAFGPSGDLYVTDPDNGKVRRITPSGVVTTIGESFIFAFGLAVGSDESVYVADFWAHRIMKISPTGAKSSLAGSSAGYLDGTLAAAQFNGPGGVAIGPDNVIYITDVFNNKIRAIDPNFTDSVTTTTSADTSTTTSTTAAPATTTSTSTTTTTTITTTKTKEPPATTTSTSTSTTTATTAAPATSSTTVAPTTTTATTAAPATSSTTVAPTTTTAAPTTSTASAEATTSTTPPEPTTTTSLMAVVIPFSPTSTAPANPIVTSTTAAIGTATTVRPAASTGGEGATTTRPAPTPPSNAVVPGSDPTTTVGSSSGIAVDTPKTGEGATIVVRGSDFEPGTTVDVEAHSTPIRLGTTTVRADGTFEYTAQLPEGLVGDHQIVAIGVSSSGQPKTVSTPVTIVAAQPLAFTGSNFGLALAALCLILGGFMALIGSRRTALND